MSSPSGSLSSQAFRLLLVVNSTVWANVEEGDRIGGFLKHHPEVLNAQPDSINSYERYFDLFAFLLAVMAISVTLGLLDESLDPRRRQ
jgi:hypothetical protein